MENHRYRPEVMAALAGRQGSSIRRSPTIGVDFLYVAVPLNGSAMRLAVPLTRIQDQVDQIRRRMLVSTALAFLPAVVLAAFFARHVSSRLGSIILYTGELAKGNFRARLDTSGKDELGVLSRQLKDMGDTLQQTVEQLLHEQAELEKLERVRKDFVINVSHELRTPLASIQGYTETLLDGALHDEEHNVRFLSIIRQNAERLGRLVVDLMTLSSLELKTQKLQFAACDLNVMLSESVDSMRPMAAKKNIAMATEPAPPGTEVFCDVEAVHQVLGNLMDNALKYTPEGGAITIGARVRAPFVEVYVADTGIGIPKEEQSRLFERFYRVDKARSRELGGTGLGLSIVKHLVRAQGGDVRVESEQGRGSTFIFTLPIDEHRYDETEKVQPEFTRL
jgi:signal transduction histidine kinase